MMASLSGTLATMGCGVPYAIAAKFAHPDRAGRSRSSGDGAMQMNGLSELITVAKYWRRWSDPRLVVLVLNNRDLNQVTWEQRAMAGRPEVRGLAGDPRLPVRAVCGADRAQGIRVDAPDQVGAALGRRRSRPTGPCVLEAVTDPGGAAAAAAHHLEQAENFALATVSDPARGAMVGNALKQMLASLVPGR